MLQGMWYLSSPTRDQTCTPALAAQSLNHWTTREPCPDVRLSKCLLHISTCISDWLLRLSIFQTPWLIFQLNERRLRYSRRSGQTPRSRSLTLVPLIHHVQFTPAGNPTGAAFTTGSESACAGPVTLSVWSESPSPVTVTLNRPPVSTLDPYSLCQHSRRWFYNMEAPPCYCPAWESAVAPPSTQRKRLCQAACGLPGHLSLITFPCRPAAPSAPASLLLVCLWGPSTLLLPAFLLLSACLLSHPLQAFAQLPLFHWRLFWLPFLKFQTETPNSWKSLRCSALSFSIARSLPSQKLYTHFFFSSIIYCWSPPPPLQAGWELPLRPGSLNVLLRDAPPHAKNRAWHVVDGHSLRFC